MSDLVERLNDNADLDAAEGADPTVVALEREAAAEIARLRTVEADNARLRSEVERLTRERDEAVAVLRLHHIMAVERGEIGLPDGDGGWIAINDGAEYCDSTLYNRTVQVIDQHPVFRPMPRGGWQQSQGWWENWLLETRMRRKAEAELTTLTARTREVLAPFAEWFPEEALRRVPPDQRLMTTGLEARHFRAANTLFNELKEKDNG